MFRLLFACALVLSASAPATASSHPLDGPTPSLLPPTADYSAAAYTAYSRSLERSILSAHEGVRLDAVRQLCRYGDRVRAGVATLDVVRLYRDSRDPRVRLLALSALHAGGDPWAIDFLRRSIPYERDARIQRIMAAIVAEHAAS